MENQELKDRYAHDRLGRKRSADNKRLETMLRGEQQYDTKHAALRAKRHSVRGKVRGDIARGDIEARPSHPSCQVRKWLSRICNRKQRFQSKVFITNTQYHKKIIREHME